MNARVTGGQCGFIYHVIASRYVDSAVSLRTPRATAAAVAALHSIFVSSPKICLKYLLHQEWQQMKRSKSDSTVILSLYSPVANLSLSLNHQSDPGQAVISKKLWEERLLSTAAIKRLIIIHRKLDSPSPHIQLTISPFL